MNMTAGKRNSCLSERENELGAGRRGFLNVTKAERVALCNKVCL